MIRLFATGTDTEIGKTTVSCTLLAAAQARGLRALAFKPAESGCTRDPDGELVAADAQRLWQAAGRGQSLESVCRYRFEEPVAPGVAAVRSGVEVDLGAICQYIRAACEPEPDLALVEGAGGLLVPLSARELIIDLAVALAWPLLIVARPGLGTINHTLLSIEAARSRSLEVRGVVFSDTGGVASAEAVASNASEIERLSGVRVLGCLPYLPGMTGHSVEQVAGSAGLLELLDPR